MYGLNHNYCKVKLDYMYTSLLQSFFIDSVMALYFSNSFWSAFPLLTPLVQTTRCQPINLVIKLLSWNIWGSSVGGMAGARNTMVPKVVRYINPDVMLLQETHTDKLVNLIMNSYPGRYMQVCAGNKKEARVIYDCQRFKGFDLSMRVRIMFVNELAMENPWIMFLPPEVEHRISIVGLTDKATEKKFIVMSFHNVYRQLTSETLAAKFRQIVHKIAHIEKALVIAGVDFNCGYNSTNGSIPSSWKDSVYIPYYQPTLRRTNIIDFFVQRNPTNMPLKSTVYAFDFLQYDWCGDVPQYNQLDYSLALDHDPLVMELTIPTTCTYIAKPVLNNFSVTTTGPH